MKLLTLLFLTNCASLPVREYRCSISKDSWKTTQFITTNANSLSEAYSKVDYLYSDYLVVCSESFHQYEGIGRR